MTSPEQVIARVNEAAEAYVNQVLGASAVSNFLEHATRKELVTSIIQTWGPLFFRAGAAHVFDTYDCLPKAGDSIPTSPSPLP